MTTSSASNTLVVNSSFDQLFQYIDAFNVESLYQDSKQIESDLSGSFTYDKISTSQIVAGSSGDLVFVDGAGLSLPISSLLNGSDSNLSWTDVGGALQEIQITRAAVIKAAPMSAALCCSTRNCPPPAMTSAMAAMNSS